MKEVTFFKNKISDSGGATKALVDISNELIKRGWYVEIIVFNSSTSTFFKLSNEVIIKPLGFSRNKFWLNKIPGLFFLYKLWNINEAFRLAKSEVIISFSGTRSYLLRLPIRFGKKIIPSFRGSMDKSQYQGYKYLRNMILLNRAAAITSNSKSVINELSVLVKASKLRYTPNPIILPSEVVDSKREKVVLAVGRLHPLKGYDTLLSAWKNLENKKNGWKLKIIGEGPILDSLKQTVKDLDIEKSVEWLGLYPDPSPYFQEASIYVLPSRREGVPNAMLDALKYKVPVVVSDLKGILEFIEDGKNGLVFPVDDDKKLTDALLKLIENKKYREELAENGWKTVLDASNKNTIDIWESVILSNQSK